VIFSTRAISAACACAAVLGATTAARAEFGDFRAIFVNRFEYSSNASSINAIMQNAADAGITDVMF
jgi:hypothetical protein